MKRKINLLLFLPVLAFAALLVIAASSGTLLPNSITTAKQTQVTNVVLHMVSTNGAGTNGQVLYTDGTHFYTAPAPTGSGGDQVWTNDGSVIYVPAFTEQVLIGTNDALGLRVNSEITGLTFGVLSAIVGSVHPNAFRTFATGADLNKIGMESRLESPDGTFGGNNGVALQGFCTVNSTNSAALIYDENDGASGVLGVTVGGTGTGQGAGVVGYGAYSGAISYGVVGFSVESGDTNIGVAGSAAYDGKVRVGGYFETVSEDDADHYIEPVYESSVLLLDNRTTELSLLTLRTNNGATVFKIDQNGSITKANGGAVPLTINLTVITNGVDTATLHFTNGILMSVTAP